MILTPQFPMSFSNKGGYEKIRTRKKLAKFHLTNLLLTNPGEKISIPEYGVGLRKYLFENMTDQVFQEISSNIRRQIKSYLSYINLQNVTVMPDEENSIKISLSYNIAGTNISDQLNIEVDGNAGTSLGLGSSYWG